MPQAEVGLRQTTDLEIGLTLKRWANSLLPRNKGLRNVCAGSGREPGVRPGLPLQGLPGRRPRGRRGCGHLQSPPGKSPRPGPCGGGTVQSRTSRWAQGVHPSGRAGWRTGPCRPQGLRPGSSLCQQRLRPAEARPGDPASAAFPWPEASC